MKPTTVSPTRPQPHLSTGLRLPHQQPRLRVAGLECGPGGEFGTKHRPRDGRPPADITGDGFTGAELRRRKLGCMAKEPLVEIRAEVNVLGLYPGQHAVIPLTERVRRIADGGLVTIVDRRPRPVEGDQRIALPPWISASKPGCDVAVNVNVRLNTAEITRLTQSPTGAIAKELLRRALLVERKAKEFCSGSMVKVQTGRLRASIHTQLGHEGTKLVATVGTNISYAGYVHDGRGPVRPGACQSPALQGERQGCVREAGRPGRASPVPQTGPRRNLETIGGCLMPRYDFPPRRLDPVVLTFGDDEEFHCRTRVAAKVWLDVVSMANAGPDQQMRSIYTFLDNVLEPESAERLAKRLAALTPSDEIPEDKMIDQQQVADVVEKLMEAYAGRPTEPPSLSSPPSNGSGRSSTAVPPGPVSTPSNSTPTVS